MRQASNHLLIVLAMAVGAVAVGAQSSAPSPPRTVTLAIVREDALLVPFATFDGQTWSNGWPESDEHEITDPPTRLSEIPREWWNGSAPVLGWELLATRGMRQRLSVTGVKQAQNHCVGMIGLSTDYVSRVQIERNSYPLPYAGIAATTPGILRLVTSIGATDLDFKAVEALLPEVFQRFEPEVWEDMLKTEYAPVLAGLLRQPHLSSLSVASLPDGRRLYYFFATRQLQYASIHPGFSAQATAMAGWYVRSGTGALRLLHANGSQSDEDGKGGETEFFPLASLTIGSRTFWMGSTSGYEWETYAVVEVGTSPPVKRLVAAAGGC